MAREYAVVSTDEKTTEILFQTAGFDPRTVSQKIGLSQGKQLWIAGQDDLESANAELHRQLQEAQDANAAKEIFLSNMSHDIRTPMNAIVGMTALAKKHIDEKARVSDALGKIEVASAHLLSLINDVLDMSRINSGRMTLSEDLFSLGDLLHDTLTLVRPQSEQKHHDFQFTVGEIHAEDLYGDPLRLRQVFVNIISNAIKYTNDHGQIAVTVTQEKQEDRCVLIFQCRDSGIGMSEQFLKKIFDPFERVSSSTISKIEGTGLGMSIVKKLIDAMGGTIEIESQLQKGTAVTVRVPMRYERVQVNTAALENRRLLIIEADPDMQAIYRRYLTEFDLRFDIVSSSSDAISALTDADFRGACFDAVIIGKSVEHVGSIFDLSAYLKKSYPQLTIVLISESNWEEIEYLANRNGIEHFIPVPFFRKSLINGLNRALEASGSEDSASSSPDLTGKHILLVEDNMINREIAQEILSVTNAAVDTAVDGREAVDAFVRSENGWYDLILMDIQMPVMDGYAATRAIRAAQRPDAKTIRIFAMTANTFAEDIAKARDAGMDGHIAKPIDINALMQVLRQFQS